ncbi:MAG: hypothetical protein H8K06_22170 [Nitrospira sp.]|nr:hypothetical protein [Nitrospira sp.]
MGRLDILVHRGCLSEQSALDLAQEIQQELPGWHIEVRAASKEDCNFLGVWVFPAFLLDGRVFATGIPKKGWLLAKLAEWEKGEP